MMRALNFARRNFKELIRDPISLVFVILLPLFLLFIFQQIQIPNEAYELKNFTAGIIVFGFSFITLFTAVLVAKDRTSSLLTRLGISPMRPSDYILGYGLALLPIILIQDILFFAAACMMGLTFSLFILLAILASVVVSILFISLGIIIGSLVSDKAASGVSSIVVQLVCFTSGMYFPKEIMGDVFSKICDFLPFEACVNIIKGVMNNSLESITVRSIIVFLVYAVIISIISIIIFKKKNISDNK